MKVTYLDDVGIDSYQTLSEWESCIKEFLSAYDVLSSVADVSYLFDKAIYIKDVALSLKMTNWLRGNSETAAQFKRAMEKWTAIELPKNSKTTSIYKSGANEVSGTVQAEAYEDAARKDNPLLLSAYIHNPAYTDNTIDINVGDSHKQIPIFCQSNILTEWLQNKGILKRFYDKATMTTRRCDEQTILIDSSLFCPTPYGNKGNRLYERIDKPDEWWCLDRGHRGSSVHLEVFNKNTKKQIHVSDVDKINFFRELTKKEKKRTIKIDSMP